MKNKKAYGFLLIALAIMTEISIVYHTFEKEWYNNMIIIMGAIISYLFICEYVKEIDNIKNKKR